MKVLHLTVKKKWFDMIASGEKKEEYRGIKPYWVKRIIESVTLFGGRYESLKNISIKEAGLSDLNFFHVAQDTITRDVKFKQFDAIKFTNGYSESAPSILIECEGIEIGTAKPEWSYNWPGNVFKIKLGKRI
jgi:hypothetical protein